MKRFAFVTILVLAAVTLIATATLPPAAGAAEKLWPKGAPTVFVGFGAGGGTDTSVRPLIVEMQKIIGETINVVNMPGAASALAAEHVMGLPNDGYSMFATGTGCYGGFLVKDTAPHALPEKWTGFYPFQGPAAMLVNPAKSGINTLDEAIARLKAGKANVGVADFGNGPHVLMEAFASLAEIKDPNYVTFGGDKNVTVAVVAGEVEIGVITFSAGIDFARKGDVKVLFLNQSTPLTLDSGTVCPAITDVFPKAGNLPMLSESWPILIRRDAPKAVIDRLEQAYREAVKQPAIVDYAKQNGMKIVALSGEEAAKLADYQFTAYAWILWRTGVAKNDPDTKMDPAKAGLPPLDQWNWDKVKAKYGY
jgi:tripartite-type tricarboxylate transporter receptor subunit TctC